MPVYKTTFTIRAARSRVWQVLASLEEYGEWNPQISQASGTLARGERVRLRLVLPNRPAMDLTATIERAEPDSLLTWRGHLMAPWFFEGYREFRLEPTTEGHTLVTHVEDIHGVFSPIFSLFMGKPIQRSHEALNEALRIRSAEIPERKNHG